MSSTSIAVDFKRYDRYQPKRPWFDGVAIASINSVIT